MPRITIKNCLIYSLSLLTLILFILLGDESKRPITTTGENLHRETGSVAYGATTINQESGYYGLLASSNTYMLAKGTYTIGIEYTSTGTDSLTILANNEPLITYLLPITSTYEKYTFTLDKDMEEVQFCTYYGGTGSFFLYAIDLAPTTRFYNDAFFFAFLVFIIGTLLPILTMLYQKNCTSNQTDPMTGTNPKVITGLHIFLIVLLIGIFASFPFFNSKLNWGDDICYHLIRIEGIKDGLRDGQFPVIIYPEGLDGHGYLNSMYPNLFLYIPACLRLVGISAATSYKFLFVIFNIATAFATYYSVKTMFDSRKAALLAAVLFTLSPYRFTNIYARAAVGEALAMTFMPILIAGLYHIIMGNKKKWWLLALGMSGLIQTHVLSALLGVILCVVIGIICITSIIRERRYFEILKAATLTLLLNLWFIIPFVYYYINGNLSTISLDWSNYTEYSLNLSGLVGTIFTGDYRTLTLGIPILACAVITAFTIVSEKTNSTLKKYTIFLFSMGCITSFMLVSIFPGWKMMDLPILDKLLSNIQFPWRLLGLASILFIVTGCICLIRCELLKPYVNIIIIVLATITLLSSTRFVEEDFAYSDFTSTYTAGHESKIVGIPKGTTAIVYPYEWRPVGTTDASITVHNVILSNSNNTTVIDYTKKGTTTKFSYTCTSSEETVVFPIINYYGYQAFDENGTKIEFTNDEFNSIQVDLIGDGKEHQITIEYKGSILFTIGFVISLLTLLFLIFIFLTRNLSNYRQFRKH